ncbi:Hsp20/alpha crystallin family protein [Psychrobacillus sp. NPDC093180]|uniref:Hsp20/alpha crystallin family protein n=1 Tax=Psychrobacillus sp. NPDC093180 TaxID=3364489 RepID=UPI0037F3BE95
MTYGDSNLPQNKKDHFMEAPEFGFKPLWNMMQQMDSLFSQFFNHLDNHLPLNSFQIDTHETATDVIVEAKLPGCNRNQIKLDIIGNVIRIGVEDSLQEEIQYPTHTGRKQFYSRREQMVTLPYTIPEQDTLVTFQNEILRISFPKNAVQRRFLTIDDQ